MTRRKNVSMRTKLTYELIEQMAALKADGLSNKDVCRAVGISEQTFYRWTQDPKNKLQRELCERLKKEESQFKQALLTTIRSAALEKTQHWTAAAWLLERSFPDEYGRVDRRREEKPAEDVPQITLGVELKVARSDDGDD